jgi:NH3-dependent NAD+ synthetase
MELGLSGGLDATDAPIVAARAMDREGRPRSDILAFTLEPREAFDWSALSALITASIGAPSP